MVSLDLCPQLSARIFGIELGDLPKQLLGALVARHGNVNSDFDDFIAATPFLSGRGHTFLAQSELLA